MTTLIFPAVTQSALDYLDSARLHNEKVIAAASVEEPQMKVAFGQLHHLPYIYDETFLGKFRELIAVYGVTQVYAPVSTVYPFLESLIREEGLALRLVGMSPVQQQVELYRKLRHKSEEAEQFIKTCAGNPEAAVSCVEIMAMLRQAGTIFGESSDEKLAAMMAVFADAPKGDVIEIGSLMGKSVSVLQYLAQRYKTGSVLSVDPLSPISGTQHDSPLVLRKTIMESWDYDVLQEAVIVNLLPTGGGCFNYLRMESESAFDVYKSSRTLSTPHFGSVPYTGRIAVIHIDGNHDLKNVSMDCQQWLTLLVPGAWLILDDYIWAHGKGPYIVGNELLEKQWDNIERAFVCGKALFVKFR
ncbi:MAG TPA: class I SAM-dependent methyltransferase [Rickettsiales bacterium]|nr:class I SAM-dependent methyltransferase [Rickettsiales bacterium]